MKQIKVVTFRIIGRERVEGILKNVEGDVATIEVDGKEEQHLISTLLVCLEDVVNNLEFNKK